MKWLAIAVGVLLVLAVGYGVYMTQVANPRVVRELREDPQGERAKKVMLLTLPSGKAIPVNYLRDQDTVYAAADGPWWRELREGGGRGSVLIQGETLRGQMRAELDDRELRDSVFERLRPTAPRFLGTMIVIELD
ncbi:MAG: hypothetical protein QNK04_25295 [Myxococcota bacterium]|nr:hypothetical protein [Myxococcota bacterium]